MEEYELTGFNSVEELQDFAKMVAGQMAERHLFQMLKEDPIEGYEREQDHFIKHAPPWEIQAWREWNSHKKATNYNKFAATKTKFMRELGEVPGYIEFYYEQKYPGYWEIPKDGPGREQGLKRVRSFFKRNPLFCTAEVV